MPTITEISTPLGKMRAGATAQGICLFDFQYRKSIDKILQRIETMSGEAWQEGEMPVFEQLRTEVTEYFSGDRTEFSIPLHLIGTPFQVSVWKGLLQIPFGQTSTYKQQSIALGNEKAIRAVAGANGENGIAIIVPCHRVIGTNGSLIGYGGGLQKKKWLLDHERKIAGKSLQGTLF